jgi:hypothetical protein
MGRNYALEYREQQQREWQVEQSVKGILERRAERKADLTPKGNTP